MTTPRHFQVISAPGPTFCQTKWLRGHFCQQWTTKCGAAEYAKRRAARKINGLNVHVAAVPTLLHSIPFHSINVSLQCWTQWYLQSEGLLLLQICHAKPTLCHSCFVAAFQLSYCKTYSQVPPSSMQADLPMTGYSFYLNTAPYM